jgi:acyl dehydratase
MAHYFEDLRIGHETILGSYTFGRDEIMNFARRFDPQLFHLSEEAGAASLFGGLCASGWHTTSIWLRLTVDNRRRIADQKRFAGERPAAYGPSPGFEKVRWMKPVFPDDTIVFKSVIADLVASKSRPAVGLLITDNTGHNQNGDQVFAIRGKIFVERRAPAIAAA